MPLHRTLSAIGQRHRVRNQGGWRILTPRHAPTPDIGAIIRAKPTGNYTRRIWFLYEWPPGRRLDPAQRARQAVAGVPKDLLARTAAFLLLDDSRSSHAIEGEHAPRDRIQRWGRAIGEAGRRPIDCDELPRLQAIVIGDARLPSLMDVRV